MGDIVPFIGRLLGKLDWSAGERARLQALADRLAGEPGAVEVAFGRSDAGEPWSALTGPDGEVLVHVARIDGRFVVHHLIEDVLSTGPTLWSALQEALGDDWGAAAPIEFAEVVPLSAQARQTHLLSILVLSAAFLEGVADTPAVLEPLPETDPHAAAPAIVEPPPPPPEAEAISDRPTPGPATEAPPKISATTLTLAFLALHEPAAADAPPAPALEPVEAPASRDAPAAAPEAPPPAAADAEAQPLGLVGTAGDDTLTGGAQGEVLLGGDGDDRLDGGGAEAGKVDWLDGGRGDDVLIVAARTVAAGGAGADTFVIRHTPPPGDVNLGRVLDFNPGDGDRLSLEEGATLVAARPEADVLEGTPAPEGLAPPHPLPGYRLGMDVDHDGRADGEVLVAGTGVEGYIAANLRPAGRGAAPIAEADAAERPLVLTGGPAEDPALLA